MNCRIFHQAQGGKLSELILLNEPSCAKCKMFGCSIKSCCILFSPGLVHYGLAPISFSSGRRGLTLQVVPLFPWPSPHPRYKKSCKIPWGGRDATAMEVLSSPCSGQWRNGDEKPYSVTQPAGLARSVRGGHGQIPRVATGMLNSLSGLWFTSDADT